MCLHVFVCCGMVWYGFGVVFVSFWHGVLFYWTLLAVLDSGLDIYCFFFSLSGSLSDSLSGDFCM